jgi:hypothetical protein
VNTRDIQLLDDLGKEFARIAGREAAASPTPKLRLRRPRAVLVGAIVLALAAGAVAAVVETTEDTAGLDAQDEAAIAEGTTSARTPWRLSTGNEDESLCVSLRVSSDSGPAASVVCGMRAGALGAGLSTDPASAATLVFGTAPDEARSGAVTTDGASDGFSTIDDERGIAGRFYVAEAPADFTQSRIVFRDADGKPLHEPAPIHRVVAGDVSLR